MKKLLLAMVMVASTLAMTAQDADAKRLGGGSSSGRQSTNVARQATPAAPAQPNQAQRPAAAPAQGAAPAAVPPKPASPWKGIAAGLIGGALLGAALSHFGLGGAMASALGSILTGVFTAPSLGGTGIYDYVANAASPEYSIAGQVWIQFQGVLTTVIWSAVVAYIAYKVTEIGRAHV